MTLLSLIGCIHTAPALVDAIPIDKLCAPADVAFIGTVTSTDVADDEDPYGLLTYGALDVERVVTGSPSDPIVVVVRGGRVGTRWERVSGYPFLEAGDRYFFALGEARQDGSRSIAAWAWVGADVALPTQAGVDSLREQHCGR